MRLMLAVVTPTRVGAGVTSVSMYLFAVSSVHAVLAVLTPTGHRVVPRVLSTH